MHSFVTWHGGVPAEAQRLEDFEAREHAAIWVRRILGKGIVQGYAAGYQLGECWWTLIFERTSRYTPYPEGAERWHLEAYDHNGRSWIGNYYYWPAQDRWRHVFFARAGDDYGRHGVPAPVRQSGQRLTPQNSLWRRPAPSVATPALSTTDNLAQPTMRPLFPNADSDDLNAGAALVLRVPNRNSWIV
jgi:hypothetical protein